MSELAADYKAAKSGLILLTDTALSALYSWIKNHPDCSFAEFSGAAKRAARLGGG
jgi:hypothetical protein